MAIKVIRVLHEQSELNSFGLNDNINVLLSEVPSNVKESFYIYRLNPDIEMPESGDKFFANLQIVDTSMVIDYTFEVKTTTNGIELVINPLQPLIPSQKYALIVTSDIRKQGDITSQKTVNLGPAEIVVSTKSSISGVDTQKYTVLFKADQVLTKKSNTVSFSVKRVDTTGGVDAAPVSLFDGKKDIFNDTTLYSDQNVVINALSGAIPFLATESFLVTNTAYSVTQKTQILSVITANKSLQVSKPTVPSGRLTIGDFNKFYEALDRQADSDSTDPTPSTVMQNTIKFEYRPPRKIRCTLDVNLDKDSLKYQDGTDASGNPIYKYKKCVRFDFDYAFGNYNLDSMGLYPEQKYMIFQDIFGKVIEFEIFPLLEQSPDYTAASLIEKTSRYHLLMKV